MSPALRECRSALPSRQRSCTTVLVAGYLLAVVLPAAVSAAVHHRCIHDAVRTSGFDLQHSSHIFRKQADGPCTLPEVMARQDFLPLRIHISYVDPALDFFNASRLTTLRTLIADATKQLSTMFSVYPVNSSLVLPRNISIACKMLDNKCNEIRRDYTESCGIGPPIIIPDEHLDGLNVWQPNGSVVKVFDKGGIADADVVFYVAGSSQPLYCATALAYTSVCKRNNIGRPLAAAVQLCPKRFDDQTDEFIYLVILHEMLHALGFSAESFTYYVDRSTPGCSRFRRPVRENLGILKLVTPATLAMASDYFNCSDPSRQSNEYGGPLESVVNADFISGSHWSQTHMQGSLMTAVIAQERVVTLDNITLAAFEDSGWYTVNYSFAQPFVFGRRAGCSFATETYCKADNVYFCQAQGTVGCHYLHRDKGNCKAADSLCSTYVASQQSACYDPDNPAVLNASLTGEAYSLSSRCFMSSLLPLSMNSSNGTMVPQGRCYEHLCNGSSLMIRAWNATEWLDCPFGSSIQVKGYAGFIQCPIRGILCSDTDTVGPRVRTTLPAPQYSTSTATAATLPATSIGPAAGFAAVFQIAFSGVSLNELKQQSAAGTFRDAVTVSIAMFVDIPLTRISNSLLQAGGSNMSNGTGIYYSCYILPPASNSSGGILAADVVKKVYDAVSAGKFNVTFQSQTYIATLTLPSMTSTVPLPKDISKNSAAVVAVSVAVGLGSAIALIIVTCVCLRKRRRFRRAPSFMSNATSTTVCEMSVCNLPVSKAQALHT